MPRSSSKEANKNESDAPERSKHKKRDGSTLRKAPQAPKRFKSSYIFFFTANQQKIKDELGKGATVTDVSKKSAEVWKNLSVEDRAYWDDVANKDKQRYIAEKAAYTGPWQVPWKRVKKDPSAPKRPMSAFLYFSQERRRVIKEKNPGMLNTEVSRILGEMWRNAPEEERNPYIEHELKERQKYKVAIAEWRKEHDAKVEAEKKQQEEHMATMTQQYQQQNNMNQMVEPYDPHQQQQIGPMPPMPPYGQYGGPNMSSPPQQGGIPQPYIGGPTAGGQNYPYNYVEQGPSMYGGPPGPYTQGGTMPPPSGSRHVVLGPNGMPQAYNPSQMNGNHTPAEYHQGMYPSQQCNYQQSIPTAPGNYPQQQASYQQSSYPQQQENYSQGDYQPGNYPQQQDYYEHGLDQPPQMHQHYSPQAEDPTAQDSCLKRHQNE